MFKNIIGYHGTKKEYVESIIDDNFKVCEDKESELLLGYGVYFFYEYDNALDWNIYRYKKRFLILPDFGSILSNYFIIESDIKVNEDDILDLDEIDKIYKLEIIVKKYANKFLTSFDYLNAKNKTSAIINMLYQKNIINKKLISKTFFSKKKMKVFDSFKKHPRKMFCVKDRSIIVKNKEKLDVDENTFNSIIYFYE